MNIKEVFNKTKTTNGDDAYKSSGNKYLDIVFRVLEGRAAEKPLFNGLLKRGNSKDILFSMFVRDPRYGLGERKVGRELAYDMLLEPNLVLQSGRADDLFYIGYWYQKKVLKKKFFAPNPYWDSLMHALLHPNQETYHNVTKWMPRHRGKHKLPLDLFFKRYKLTSKEYRKLIVNNNTVEAILSRKDTIKDYSKVPSLAMIKHMKTFKSKDYERFMAYLEEVSKGKAKINTSVSTPVDVWMAQVEEKERQILWDNLEKMTPKSILCIVDQSGSMDNDYKSIYKARAIAKYVSQSSTYLPNEIVTFSSEPRLLSLGETLVDARRVFSSYDDISNTDLGKVFDRLNEVTEDLPEYLLILSDMQFDAGSAYAKNNCMAMFKNRGITTKIIWWNLNNTESTFPEMDSQGNIFISGYNPKLLSYLESGFDGEAFIDKLLETYKEKILAKLK